MPSVARRTGVVEGLVCFVNWRETTRLPASDAGVLEATSESGLLSKSKCRGDKRDQEADNHVKRSGLRASNSEQANVLLHRLRRVIIITLAQHPLTAAACQKKMALSTLAIYCVAWVSTSCSERYRCTAGSLSSSVSCTASEPPTAHAPLLCSCLRLVQHRTQA